MLLNCKLFILCLNEFAKVSIVDPVNKSEKLFVQDDEADAAVVNKLCKIEEVRAQTPA